MDEDRTILSRIIEIEKLESRDKKAIIHVIDSLLRDAKAKKTYATG